MRGPKPRSSGVASSSPSMCATPIQSSAPSGTLSGVLRSPCMSRYTRPRRPSSGRCPATVPRPTVQSPPSTSASSPRGECGPHALGGLGRAGDDGREILRVRAARDRAPAPDLGVAVIDHRDAGRLQPGEQAGVAQCARRLLLPGRVRTGARRHADHTERSRHGARSYSAGDESQPRRQRRLENALALHARRAAHTRMRGDLRHAAADEAAPAEGAAAHLRRACRRERIGDRVASVSCGSASAYIGSRGSSGTRPRCGRARRRRRRRWAPSRSWRAAAGCGRSRGRCA